MDTENNELRTVTIGNGGFAKVRKGYFHKWFKRVDSEGDESIYAVIELENGKIVQEPADGIKFTDR